MTTTKARKGNRKPRTVDLRSACSVARVHSWEPMGDGETATCLHCGALALHQH